MKTILDISHRPIHHFNVDVKFEDMTVNKKIYSIIMYNKMLEKNVKLRPSA